MDATQPPRQNRVAGPVVLLYVAFLFFDLLAAPVVNSAASEVPAGIIIGGLWGQLALLASWAVVGPGKLLARWPLTLLATALLYIAFCAGYLMVSDGEATDYAIQLLLLPILFIALQAPVWILKWATGCRMVVDRGDGSLPPRGSRQFGLRDLLGATTVVAASLGLARMGFSGVGGSGGHVNSDALVGLAVFGGVAAVWSGLVTLPSLVAALVTRDVVRGVLAMAVYTILMTVVLALGLDVASPGPQGPMLPFFLFLNGSTVFVLFGSLLIARASGYVLLWPRRSKPGAQPSDASSTEGPDETTSQEG